MLNALSVSLHGASLEGVERGRSSLLRQGFATASRVEWERGTLDAWSFPTQVGVDDSDVRTSGGVAVCVGPVWYRGRFGTDALKLLIDDVGANGRADESAFRGNFALFVRTARCCLLANDPLGFVRIYTSPDRLFWSTSWLATVAYAGHVELDEAAAIEYVLLGASHSERTVARGITTLPLGQAVDLDRRRPVTRLRDGVPGEAEVAETFDGAVEAIRGHLLTVFREIATAFPERTRTALSGGFDSRLIVAGLLASGHRPDLFVYGDSGSADVRVSKAVAERIGLPLTAIDKRILNRQWPMPDLERLVDSALFFDGLPVDGIHDPGADQQTRLEQTAAGKLVLNGGGGEIFRNYFHLPDRPLRAIDVVRTFYRGFDRRVFRRRDGLARYEEDMAMSIGRSVGQSPAVPAETITRQSVELVYPLFRCHHWMAVNNSIGIRHGYQTTPLIDVTTVRMAWRLPLAWKNAGRLESQLITRLHPAIAAEMSAHGFRFSDGPDWHARLEEWSTCRRPVFARPYINAARRRLSRLGVTTGFAARYRSMLSGEWQLDSILDLKRLPDNQAFARALAVEIVFRLLVS